VKARVVRVSTKRTVQPAGPFQTNQYGMPILDEVPGDLKLAGDVSRIESVSSRMH